MAADLVEDIIEWWQSEYGKKRGITHKKPLEILTYAFQELGIIHQDEVILSSHITKDWIQESEETFVSLVESDVKCDGHVRTTSTIAFAIVTPPGIPIENRVDEWQARADRLRNCGVNVPTWYLIWHGTIYAYWPHHSLSKYLEYDLPNEDLHELAESLMVNFNGLGALALRPLGLLPSLRTNGYEVFYCGELGFNTGISSRRKPEPMIKEYEREVLPYLPEKFRKVYYEIRRAE